MASDLSPDSPGAVAARAAAVADRRRVGAAADFFLDDDARLDDRTRAMLGQLLAGVVGELDTAIRRHAARLLSQSGDDAAAEALLAMPGDVLARVAKPGLLPVELLDEMIARVRHDLIADALPVSAGTPDEPSLVVRLAGVPDTVVAGAATALLAAESRRRGGAGGSELPAELHHRLAWLVAAGLHAMAAEGADRALADAARRSIAAHDEGERLEAVALRLAIAIDARANELPALLVEALGDRRLALFVAVLAHALAIDSIQLRALVVEPDDERLWLALRAVALDRPTIARIALALADADPRRDIEAFAERIDTVVAIDADAARAALASLTLPADFRAAIRAVASR